MTKTYIVTGGAGFIGSHIAEGLLAKGAERVILFDNYSLGSPETVDFLLENPLALGVHLFPNQQFERAFGHRYIHRALTPELAVDQHLSANVIPLARDAQTSSLAGIACGQQGGNKDQAKR